MSIALIDGMYRDAGCECYHVHDDVTGGQGHAVAAWRAMFNVCNWLGEHGQAVFALLSLLAATCLFYY